MAHATIAWAPHQPCGVHASFDGVDFQLELQDNLQRTLFYLGHYEEPLHDLLVAEYRPGDVFVDVGANIGVHALTVARRRTGDGAVIAFEPAADTATILRETALRNGLLVDVHEVALGRGTAVGELRQSPNWAPADLGVRSLYGDGQVVERVQIQSFDDWASSTGLTQLDLVKIDVEGAEFDVLAGMRESLLRLRPRLLIVEVIDHFLVRSGSSAAELDGFLADVGYVIQGPTVAEISQGPTDGLWPNAVYRPVES
jgi:FkbM family methyltransferase